MKKKTDNLRRQEIKTFVRKICTGLIVLFLIYGSSSWPVWGADNYDDAQVIEVSVTAQNPADQAGPITFYDQSQLKVVCKYRYVQTGSGGAIPWTSLQLYTLSGSGTPLVFSNQKTCLPGTPIKDPYKVGAYHSQTCTVEGVVSNLPQGGVGIGCKITRQDGGALTDVNVANNKKEVFISVKPRPTARVGSVPAVAAPDKPSTGVVPGLSGAIKQCPASISAMVKVDPHQFINPLNSPVDMAETKMTLYLQKSEAAANNVNCYYASNNKDVPNLVVTIKCPNASPQSGQMHSYTCSQ